MILIRHQPVGERDPWRDLPARIRAEIDRIDEGEPDLIFQIRRYILKQLMYDERGTLMDRRLLKAPLYERQKELCGLCREPMEKKGNHLHRTHDVSRGYKLENTIPVHGKCRTD